jgi:hypothetical protein
MRWRSVVLVAICAALMFGGTFTCTNNSSSIDDDDTETSAK